MKRAAAILGLAIAGSQAGHLLAYELRFGAAARAVQSTGPHAYFPLLLKTLLGASACGLIASLLLVGVARLVAGGRLERGSAPSLLRLASILFTVQLGCFVLQESLEGGSASQVALWGLVGQMPVALVGALAFRWLFARVAPAVAALAHRMEPALRLHVYFAAPVLCPVPVPLLAPHITLAGPVTRRGPPPSF